MKRFTVYYHDKYGDLSHVWVEAENREDAIFQVKHEYWDCEEILSVTQQR